MTGSIDYYTRKTISKADVRARVEHLNRIHAEEYPDDPPHIVEDAVIQMQNLPSTTVLHYWVHRQGNGIIAQCRLDWTELESNRNLAFVGITVEPGQRRQGIATELLRRALEVAGMAGRHLLISGCSDRVPAGGHFLENAGFRPKFESHTNQLAIDQLDAELMANWRANGCSQAKDYAIELWDGPVPEARLVAFAKLTNVMNTAPREGLEIEDTEVTPTMIREREKCFFSVSNRQLISCARHLPTNELAGYTELSWSAKQPTIVWQGDTGVIESHRGCGLGRWLKAANIEALLKANPAARFVRTGNADSNAAMLAINRKMGFLPYVAETAWQGEVEEIARRIARPRVSKRKLEGV